MPAILVLVISVLFIPFNHHTQALDWQKINLAIAPSETYTPPESSQRTPVAEEQVAEAPQTIQVAEEQVASTPAGVIPQVPFYSQFRDIASATWQKVGCGITDLAMIIDYYVNDAPSVETLLAQGIAAGAYDTGAGWTYQGLIDVSQQYGLDGSYYTLAGSSDASALARLKAHVQEGPVIASVHYKFDPRSTIPHLVVINAIDGDTIYYNDPAAASGGKQISASDFLKAWKKRFIVIRPTEKADLAIR